MRIRRRNLDRRAVGEDKSRIDVVLRLLANRLNERELGQREWRGDAGLLKPDHSVTRTNHPGLAEPVSETDARSEIAALEFSGGTRKVEDLRFQIENGTLAVGLS